MGTLLTLPWIFTKGLLLLLHHFLFLADTVPPNSNDKGRRNRDLTFDKLKPYAHPHPCTILNNGQGLLITYQNKAYL